ncbi:hypothetical protein [Zhihengliuella sp. ISTPL4]|uniref:hypothetical protein n=1 Tax=Zhihengliuella sp. ISTPL4 TaxID=2058657 RepID=UPI000C7BF65A|nr:hypothetical protein [Zhihengliuella sp. ISTPL4]
MSPSRKPAVVRGFATSSLAIFVALAGHVTGGGEMPGPLGILVPWVFAFMASVLLAGRRLSLTRLTLSVAVSQFLFHALFVLGTVSPSGVTIPHVHGAPLVLPAADSGAVVVTADASMWIGHALAALLTVTALHRGERLLFALRELAVHLVRWVRRRADVVLSPRSAACSLRLTGFLDVRAARDLRFLAPLHGRAPPSLPAL